MLVQRLYFKVKKIGKIRRVKLIEKAYNNSLDFFPSDILFSKYFIQKFSVRGIYSKMCVVKCV